MKYDHKYVNGFKRLNLFYSSYDKSTKSVLSL